MGYNTHMKKSEPGPGAYAGKSRRTLAVYLGFIFLAAGAVAFQARSVLFFPSTGRTRVSAAAVGDAVFLVGGLSANGVFLDDVLRIDTVRSRMRRAARLPGGLIGCEAVAASDSLYVMGGYTGSAAVDSVLRLDPRRGVMQAAGHLPGPRAFGAAAAVGSRVFYLGGWDGSRVLDEISVFDAVTGRSTVEGRLPSPRQYAAAAVFEGRILLVGGEDAGGEPCPDLLELDPSTLAVVHSVPLPQPPVHPRLAVLEGRIVCYDGFADEPLGVLTILDPVRSGKTRVLAEPLPSRDVNLALAAGADAVYLAGGADARNPRQLGVLRVAWEWKAEARGEPGPADVTSLKLRTFLLLR
jgi:hypothetical protein